LVGAVFCEDFEGGRNTVGNRNGDWSVSRFSAARWSPSINPDPQWVGRASIPACRAGAAGDPLPPGDTLICDPSSVVRSHYGLTSTAIQNYGDNSYRVAQPFDIANRTGTISFNVDLHTDGGLLGWPTLTFTSEPYSAPAYLADNAAGATPREGLEIYFNGVCPGSSGWTAFPTVRIYHRYRETELRDENGFANNCAAITTQAGHLNHVEVRISTTHLEIRVSSASADGVTYPAAIKRFSTPIDLAFTRGNLYFGVHNHATVKYAGLASWTVLWDNLAFDGPAITPQRVAQVNNNTVAADGGIELGYPLPNSATTTNPPALTFSPLTTTGATTATLVFNMAGDTITNTNWSNWRVNYRLNNTTWHAAAISPDELSLIPTRASTFTFSLNVPLSELTNGTNTIQLTGTGFYGGYKPYTGNIDLIVN
jgi:hypothetical protein